MMKTAYDVREIVRLAGYAEPPTEIAKYLTNEAIECYERHNKEIERYLWDNKMTDKQAAKWRSEKRTELAEEIIAINDWLHEELDK